jgi:hypothetical protein
MSGMASGSADPPEKKPKPAAITDPTFEILSAISKLKPANDHQAGIRDVLESIAAMCVHGELIVNTLSQLLPPRRSLSRSYSLTRLRSTCCVKFLSQEMLQYEQAGAIQLFMP